MDTPNKLTEQAKKILEERCAAFEAGYATQQKMLGIQANRIAELEAQLAAAILSADNERTIWVNVVSARAAKEVEELAQLRAELEAVQAKLAEYEGGRWHSFETVQAIVRERDAALAKLSEYEGENKRWRG